MASKTDTTEHTLSADQQKKRRGRSIALAVALAALVAIFYAVTIIKLGPGVMDRPL
ncbi:hypothetical protein [Pseudovibrio exalbescens]|uniref:hypothetical protein n=1 Tax=Pseudovibrio exalbescens TaxID=197461 RepID=UPI000420C85D|nr:hypothetical protein [Pseudovibrio exalbescens]